MSVELIIIKSINIKTLLVDMLVVFYTGFDGMLRVSAKTKTENLPRVHH